MQTIIYYLKYSTGQRVSKEEFLKNKHLYHGPGWQKVTETWWHNELGSRTFENV